MLLPCLGSDFLILALKQQTFTRLKIGNIGKFNDEFFAENFQRTYTFSAARTSALFMDDIPPAPFEAWEPMDFILPLSARQPTSTCLRRSASKWLSGAATDPSLERLHTTNKYLAKKLVYPPEAVTATIIPWKRLEYGDEQDTLREDFVDPGNMLRDKHGLPEKSEWYGFMQDERSHSLCSGSRGTRSTIPVPSNA
ncbi:hypothetical protein M413DRAFT_32014 [Hebeloma cylindrosporum]|uniref:Uncharacterized protein n=1 Tax=Hebeloma cylindrosporum TaxID=76867 RepID=A0A0C3BHF0_HEBCY|nr:hypothetical protein M413DRAFT_32014 [Hebeloma cylindrosporum h7]